MSNKGEAVADCQTNKQKTGENANICFVNQLSWVALIWVSCASSAELCKRVKQICVYYLLNKEEIVDVYLQKIWLFVKQRRDCRCIFTKKYYLFNKEEIVELFLKKILLFVK